MRTSMIAVVAALCATPTFAQQAAPAFPACDGDYTIVRVSHLKSAGSLQGFMAAAAAHQKWYRDHGITDNQIVVSRVIERDAARGVEKYSDTLLVTYHIRPPARGRVKTGDDSWNAYVKQYRDNSDIRAEYMTCVPKRS